MQQFIHQSVLTAYPHHIKRDSGGHAHDKGFLGHGNLLAHLVHGGSFTKHLDDGVVVEAEHGAYTAHTDDLAAVNTQLAQGTLYGHHLGKAGHAEHIIYLRIHFRNPELLKALGQHQQDAKTGTGDILQLTGIYGKMLDGARCGQQLIDVGTYLRRDGSVQSSAKCQRGFSFVIN